MNAQSEAELQREIARLRAALNDANERLAIYEKANDTTAGFIVGDVIKTEQPALVRSKSVVYAVHLTTHNVREGGRYIFPFRLDGNFDRRCNTHHVVLHTDSAIPVTSSKSSALTSEKQLMLWLFTQFLSVYGKMP